MYTCYIMHGYFRFQLFTYLTHNATLIKKTPKANKILRKQPRIKTAAACVC